MSIAWPLLFGPMEFKVVRASVPQERDQWQSAWHFLPVERRDVYFLPGYLQAYEAEGKGEACCAIALAKDSIWLYPFLKCPLENTVGFQASRDLCDVQTPYGYGGPVVNQQGEDARFLRDAWAEWSTWCAGTGVIGEFVRFHPLLDNRRWAPQEMRVFVDRQTVPMWLDRYPQMVWNDSYFRRHRHMIRKAEREGCYFESLTAAGQMSWFALMYAKTQDRLRAKDDTRFGSAYFETLSSELGKRAWLGVVRQSGEVVAAVFVLEGVAFAHSHLMGDRRANGPAGIANLVYHGIALEAARHGLRVLHMGGGRTVDEKDSLFRFKVSLSPDRANFWLGTRCHNPEAYECLGSEWEARHGPRPAGYFLFYRLQVRAAG